MQCQVALSGELVFSMYCQVECRPWCGVEWLVGRKEQVVHTEDERYQVKEELILETEVEFQSLISSLTWLRPSTNEKKFPISCRLEIVDICVISDNLTLLHRVRYEAAQEQSEVEEELFKDSTVEDFISSVTMVTVKCK